MTIVKPLILASEAIAVNERKKLERATSARLLETIVDRRVASIGESPLARSVAPG